MIFDFKNSLDYEIMRLCSYIGVLRRSVGEDTISAGNIIKNALEDYADYFIALSKFKEEVGNLDN